MVYWRRRQPEPEARRLLGREPARLVPAHQGCPDLRLHQQSVQSQIRDRRHFLRYAIDGRGRDTERADRPPHGHAGTAALGLCRHACEVVRPIGRSRHAWSFPRADFRLVGFCARFIRARIDLRELIAITPNTKDEWLTTDLHVCDWALCW